MSKTPKVSIVIPTYNRSQVISRAIDSVLTQTYENWELLIVDDGSTDDTKKNIENKYVNDTRIQIIGRPETRPKGANACRNIGIENAKGKYIALLDSDDEWKKQYIENCIKTAGNQANFYGCYSAIYIKRENYLFKKKSRPLRDNETHVDFLLGDGDAQTSSYFMNRAFASDVKFDETLQRHQDWDFFIRFGEKYSWTFNNFMEVINHRKFDNIYKKIDLASCIKFYKRHRSKINNLKNKKDYLYSQYKRAIINKDKNAAAFYKEELMTIDNRMHFVVRFPALYRFYVLLRQPLQINKIKKMTKYYFK